MDINITVRLEGIDLEYLPAFNFSILQSKQFVSLVIQRIV